MFLVPGNGGAAIGAQVVAEEAGRRMEWVHPVSGVLTGSVFGLWLSHEAGVRGSDGFDRPL